jgi:hypothetical protein
VRTQPGSPPQRARVDAWVRVAHGDVDYVLERAGVPHLFLKGPSIADWLYEEGERRFIDVDVLVPPDRLVDAVVALREHHYLDTKAGTAAGEVADHSRTLRRADGTGCEVDVHDRFPGMEADASAAWELLSSSVEKIQVAHRMIPVPDAPRRLLLTSLHTARDGRASSRVVRDIERAIDRASRQEWVAAGRLSEAAGAAHVMRAGLEVSPKGAALADELQLPRNVPASWRLAADSAWGPALQLARLREAPLRRRLRIVLREVWPTPAFMHLWDPASADGRWAMIRAKIRRLAGLLRRFPSDARRVRQARSVSAREGVSRRKAQGK